MWMKSRAPEGTFWGEGAGALYPCHPNSQEGLLCGPMLTWPMSQVRLDREGKRTLH